MVLRVVKIERQDHLRGVEFAGYLAQSASSKSTDFGSQTGTGQSADVVIIAVMKVVKIERQNQPRGDEIWRRAYQPRR